MYESYQHVDHHTLFLWWKISSALSPAHTQSDAHFSKHLTLQKQHASAHDKLMDGWMSHDPHTDLFKQTQVFTGVKSNNFCNTAEKQKALRGLCAIQVSHSIAEFDKQDRNII